MMVRCKFRCVKIELEPYSQKFCFKAEYDQTIPEDVRFGAMTPCGEMWFQTSGKFEHTRFQAGKTYYFDIIPTET